MTDIDSNPVVAKLKEVDDHYLKVKKEFDQKVRELEKEYTAKLQPFLKQREEVLGSPNADDTGFDKEFCDDIEEWDRPVLEYLENIETDDIDADNPDKGFYVEFKFRPNPFFRNACLRKTYFTESSNDYVDQQEITKIESTAIEWEEGKDVTKTIITKTKKRKGGGAKKKGKDSTVTSEKPRRSFFRYFREVSADTVDELMEEENLLNREEDEDDDVDNESDMDPMEKLQMYLEEDWERASTLQCNIIPHAIRWYTGEACPDDFDEDDDEGSESEGDGDDNSPTASGNDVQNNSEHVNDTTVQEKAECKQQ